MSAQFNRWFYRRQRIAKWLGKWSHRWLFSKTEILDWNEHMWEMHDVGLH